MKIIPFYGRPVLILADLGSHLQKRMEPASIIEVITEWGARAGGG